MVHGTSRNERKPLKTSYLLKLDRNQQKVSPRNPNRPNYDTKFTNALIPVQY